MLGKTSITGKQASANTDTARRDSKNPPWPGARRRPNKAISVGLLQIDQHGVGREKADHDRDEIDEVAGIDDAARNGVKVAEQTGADDSSCQSWRRPTLEQAK